MISATLAPRGPDEAPPLNEALENIDGAVSGPLSTSSLLAPFIRFSIENTGIIAVKAKVQAENTLRYINLASFIPFDVLEESKFVAKIWRVVSPTQRGFIT